MNINRYGFWEHVPFINLSGLSDNSADVLNVTALNTWTDVLRIDDNNIRLYSLFFRSSLNEDGTNSVFKPNTTSATLLSLRLYDPYLKIAYALVTDLSLSGASPAAIGLYEASNTFIRSFQPGTTLQAKVATVLLKDDTGTKNRLDIKFLYDTGTTSRARFVLL